MLPAYLSVSAEGGWEALFNGKDLSNWYHYLAKPDKSIDVAGLPRNADGTYQQPIGFMSEDPLKVFSVVEEDGESCIRISGKVIGNLFTQKPYGNYHLKLLFKWGDIKWDWMKGRPKDGGILYHYNRLESGQSWRHEFQIHEGDVGSYWARHPIVDIPAGWTDELPDAIRTAAPFLKELVSTLSDTMLMFEPNHKPHHFDGSGKWQIVIANPLNEKPSGEWNTLELICYENHSVHKVNGKTNMVVLNGKIKIDGAVTPITKGSIQLQSEGAEIFFKDIQIRTLEKMPPELEGIYFNLPQE